LVLVVQMEPLDTAMVPKALTLFWVLSLLRAAVLVLQVLEGWLGAMAALVVAVAMEAAVLEGSEEPQYLDRVAMVALEQPLQTTQEQVVVEGVLKQQAATLFQERVATEEMALHLPLQAHQ
jgi:hypothetical protein